MNAPVIDLAVPRPIPLSVRDYLLLDENGAFAAYGKTELIDGAILAVNAQHSEHFTVKNLLFRRLADACDALGTGIEAWSEGSIRLSDFSVPEPDIFVTSERPVAGLVRLETVLLVIEVASTTLDFDMGKKARIYACAGIPEYWVVDVNARTIRQMWAPSGETFDEYWETALEGSISAVTIDGITISTNGI